ncbi:response regulator [Thalassotalea sp. ND16A]|uniref:response regulator n=1 Tax=Thalassotalea sp. ND16A TaxID=1535422 RepID=UPI00051CF359|nr:response regulator [Thalassotalea sp. ND16A]KGJ98460.1 response regulator receiver protein [Thalassotalea sp. ND16A]
MAETTNSFKDVLANIRHDLKTPVGHILGYSEMLAEDLEDNPWPEFEQDLERIHASGNKLLTLIEDLLGPNKSKVEDIDITSVEYQLRMQLNHISGYCEMLTELVEEENRSEFLTDLNHINQAAKNFTEIVADKVTIATLSSLEFCQPQSNESAELATTSMPSVDKIHFNTLGEGGNILIVDDNAANRELLTRRLIRNGYQAKAVDGGKTALTLLESQSYDLILLDMVMPEMSGLEVLAILKKDKILRNIPVIILSALDDIDQIVHCILLGADDYVFKPFNPILLKARIAASLEKFRLRKNQVPRLKVFISSPGDVIAERQIARAIINEINDELVERVHLVPVFWEDEPLLASDTFQAQISPAKDCDIYIGIFWSRLGSKLPETITREDGSRYFSGSEYEFEDAIAGYKEKGVPQILVYRKTSEIIIPLQNREQVMDSLEQKEKVENFIQQWFMSQDNESYSGAFHGFASEDDFSLILSKHLKKLVLNQLENL